MVAALAGIDVGGTNLKVILTSTRFEILDQETIRTPAHAGGDAIIVAAVRLLRTLVDRNYSRRNSFATRPKLVHFRLD